MLHSGGVEAEPLPFRSWRAPGTASSAARSGSSLLRGWGGLRAEPSSSPGLLPATTPASPPGPCTSTCCTWHTKSRGWTLSSTQSPLVTGSGFSSAGLLCTPWLQQQPGQPQHRRQVTAQATLIATSRHHLLHCKTARPLCLQDPGQDARVLAPSQVPLPDFPACQ